MVFGIWTLALRISRPKQRIINVIYVCTLLMVMPNANARSHTPPHPTRTEHSPQQHTGNSKHSTFNNKHSNTQIPDTSTSHRNNIADTSWNIKIIIKYLFKSKQTLLIFQRKIIKPRKHEALRAFLYEFHECLRIKLNLKLVWRTYTTGLGEIGSHSCGKPLKRTKIHSEILSLDHFKV